MNTETPIETALRVAAAEFKRAGEAWSAAAQDRQIAVVSAVNAGLSFEEIGRVLGVSPQTAEWMSENWPMTP